MKMFAAISALLFLAAQNLYAGAPDVLEQCPAAAGGKVVVCHFSEEDGEWLPLLLPPSAAKNHLNRHDDALPGGITGATSTQLDADCAAAVVVDPQKPVQPVQPAQPAQPTGNAPVD